MNAYNSRMKGLVLSILQLKKMKYSFLGVVFAIVLASSPLRTVEAGGVYGWHLANIGVTEKLHSTRKNRGAVNVGILDQGALCSHTELTGRCSMITHPNEDPSVGNHGTHVSTTVGASDIGTGGMVGVAPDAFIHSYAIFSANGFVGYADGINDYGDCRTCYSGNIIDYLRDVRKVSVTNHSYGTSARYGNVPASNFRTYVAAPKNKNLIFVWAAGNDNKDIRNVTFQDNLQARDRMKNFVYVVALDSDNEPASFTNTPGENGFCNISSQVCLSRNKYKYFTISAPGVNIWAGSAAGGYMNMSGTSMAAPIVTGVVALLHGRWPALKNNAAKTTSILFRTAQDLGKKGVDATYGYGLVRADRALGPLGAKWFKRLGKKHSFTSTNLRVSPALSNLTGHSVTFFDEYDRDFQIPLATFAPSYNTAVRDWMRKVPNFGESITQVSPRLSYTVSTNGYNPTAPSLSDLDWRLSYQADGNQMLHFGQGSALDQLALPASLSFGLMSDKSIQAGAYPVMSLAEGGVFALAQRPTAFGFSVTSGVMTNVSFDDDAEERDYAPKTDALMVSLERLSDNKRLSTSVSFSYLREDNGVLGTGGTGGLSFVDHTYSQGVTLGSSLRMTKNTRISASYTEAFSDADTSSNSLLALNSSNLSSSAFALGFQAKQILRADDTLSFSISQPLRIGGGSMSLTHDDYYDEDETLHSRSVDIDLRPNGRQMDYQLEYVFSPRLDKLRMGLFAYYSDEYLHQESLTDHGIGFRLNKTF